MMMVVIQKNCKVLILLWKAQPAACRVSVYIKPEGEEMRGRLGIMCLLFALEVHIA